MKCKSYKTLLLYCLLFLPATLLCAQPLAKNYDPKPVAPNADRGLYAIWYGDTPDVLKLPFIKGGQLVLQWGQLEISEGKYNFKLLDDALQKMAKQNLKITVQVNGNTKPAYLYERIAMNPKKLSPQIRDPQQGTLQFWDPLYLQYYLKFVQAYGKHLQISPYRKAVLAVRLNYNPIGTEHYFNDIGSAQYKTTDADKDYHNYNLAPDGHRYEQSFTNDGLTAYMQQVDSTFIAAFSPNVKVLARYDGLMPDHGANPTLGKALGDGKMGVFMTNSEARHAQNAKAQIFIDYCRNGKTVGYAEQFSDAEGHHAGGLMNFPQSPPAWNYWRLLGDLDEGISYIAIYGVDLAKDNDPEYHAGFEFANRYVGYHASPAQAPGAWVALRNLVALQKSAVVQKSGPLENLDFLMKETSAVGETLANVGPKNQRYGAWARRIGMDEKLSFSLNSNFAKSISGQPVKLHLIYYDSTTTPFTLQWNDNGKMQSKSISRIASNQWQETFIDIPVAGFAGEEKTPDIMLSGGGVFHLVEVIRSRK